MVMLNSEQTEAPHRVLRDREGVLRAEIRDGLLRSDEEHYADLAGAVADVGDGAVAHLLADIEIAAVDRDVQELREIEQALVRLSDDAFGVCPDCDTAIDYRRLEAEPWALRCVDCQTRHERGFAHTRTPSL